MIVVAFPICIKGSDVLLIMVSMHYFAIIKIHCSDWIMQQLEVNIHIFDNIYIYIVEELYIIAKGTIIGCIYINLHHAMKNQIFIERYLPIDLDIYMIRYINIIISWFVTLIRERVLRQALHRRPSCSSRHVRPVHRACSICDILKTSFCHTVLILNKNLETALKISHELMNKVVMDNEPLDELLHWWSTSFSPQQ